MTARLGNTAILQKLKDLHGDTYDLSRVTSDRRHAKVEIGCKVHGWVTTELHNLLRGQRGCNLCRGANIAVGKRLPALEFVDRLRQDYPTGYDFTTVNYTNMTTNVRIKCSTHGEFEALPLNLLREDRNHLCPKCEAGTHMSNPEKSLLEWCQTLGVAVESGNRTVIAPKEIDVWFPEYNFGVELHGLYWHRGVAKGCHTKYKLAMQKGVRLIQVFEDEWYSKSDIIKDLIKAKLGLRETLFARKTLVKIISAKEANAFYDKWHIAGGARGAKHIGLFYNNELVAALTIGKSRYTEHSIEIVRYAAACNVVGGFSRLFKALTLPAGTSVISYVDLRIGTGAQYIAAGFKDADDTPPDYWWVKRLRRIPRYQTQKHLLKTHALFSPFYDVEKSESDICTAAGYAKIYGVGHKKLVLIVE